MDSSKRQNTPSSDIEMTPHHCLLLPFKPKYEQTDGCIFWLLLAIQYFSIVPCASLWLLCLSWMMDTFLYNEVWAYTCFQQGWPCARWFPALIYHGIHTWNDWLQLKGINCSGDMFWWVVEHVFFFLWAFKPWCCGCRSKLGIVPWHNDGFDADAFKCWLRLLKPSASLVSVHYINLLQPPCRCFVFTRYQHVKKLWFVKTCLCSYNLSFNWSPLYNLLSNLMIMAFKWLIIIISLQWH